MIGLLKKIVYYLKLIIVDGLLFICSLCIRRDNTCIAIGSWNGLRYADNSKYLAKYLCSKRKDLKVYWIGDVRIKDEVENDLDGVKFLPINVLSTQLILLKCKYMFFSQMHSADISIFYVYRNAVLCLLHHGTAIKKWGQDGLNQKVGDGRNFFEKIKLTISGERKQYDYFVTSSPEEDRTHMSAIKYRGCCFERIIKTGTPRNDLFFNVDQEMVKVLKNKYADIVGYQREKGIILYLPTFRRTTERPFSFLEIEDKLREEVFDILERNNYIIIEKSHVVKGNDGKNILGSENILCADKSIDAQELMLIADALITDYSSAALDYTLLDRPIINLVYDYDYYKNYDSGLYYELSEFATGDVVVDINQLPHAIEMIACGNDEYKYRRRKARKKFMAYETGNASEKITDKVIRT